MKLKNEYIKKINSLSLPILMNYLVTSLFEILDKAIIGHYSTDGFAVIGIASSVIFAITGSLGIFSAAYSIVAAEMAGKHDDDMFEKAFYSAMFVSICIGIMFIVLSLGGGRTFFKYVYRLEDHILQLLLSYFYPASITVLLNMVIFMFSAYFRNKLNTKITFYSTLVATVINVFFDYVLVNGKLVFPELGVSGAAWGSVIGLLAGIVVYIVAMSITDKKIMKLTFSIKSIIRMIKLYIPLLGQDIMESTVFIMIISGIVSRLGTYSMASYSLLESLGNIIILPVFAYSTSATTVAIQKKAAGDNIAVKSILKAAILLSLTLVSLMGIISIIFPERIMGFIVSDSQTIEISKRFVIYLVIAQIINIFYQIYKSYLQGTDNERYVFKTSVIVSLLSLIWIYLLLSIAGIGGLYIGLAIKYMILWLLYFIKENIASRLKGKF